MENQDPVIPKVLTDMHNRKKVNKNKVKVLDTKELLNFLKNPTNSKSKLQGYRRSQVYNNKTNPTSTHHSPNAAK